MIIRFLNILFSLLITAVLQGQQYDKKDFKVYQIKDGLSYNKINTITQDAYGYIWIGSEKGLNRFDGSNFRQFYSDSFPESLPEDRVFNFRWVNEETLGVLTASGFHMINTKTLKMKNLIIPEDSSKQIPNLNRVFDVLIDKRENIFISTASGFYHFNHGKLVFRYDQQPKQNTIAQAGSFGWDLAKFNDHTILLSTVNGLYIYHIDKKDFHQFNEKDDPFFNLFTAPAQVFRFTYTDEKYFSVSNVRRQEVALFDIQKKSKELIHMPDSFATRIHLLGSLHRLNDTLMASASPASGFYLIRHDNQTNTWMLDTTLYFKNDFCTGLLFDKNNRLWVATTDGLYKQNIHGGSVRQTRLPSDGASYFKTITGLAVANNKVFVTTALQGVYVFDRDSFLLSNHIIDKERPPYITKVLKVNEDSLITANKGNIIDTRSLEFKKFVYTTKANKVQALFKDSQNRIYVTKYLVDTLYYKDPWSANFSELYLPGLNKIRTPFQMGEDNEGNLWFGGHGLIRLNNKTKELDRFVDSFPFIKTRNKDVNSNIVFDRSGKMYFGVENNGLTIYDVKEKRFTHLTRQDGLPDNNVEMLFLHENKTLWIATENGLASYDLDSNIISAFGASDGIPADVNRCNALYFDPGDRLLYAAFTPVIIRFDPLKLKKNKTPPEFFIESIDITGRNSVYLPGGIVTVPYKNNSVIVNLSAINFEDASQQLFSYRIVKNGNESWQELGSQNKIFFNNLAAGKHKLQLKVYIRNHSWPDQIKEILLIVKPPFWKTIWFYLIVGLFVSAMLYYFHKRRIAELTQKASIDKQFAQTEMKALHAQMNPHFIFNCLNSIREMILNNENEQASLYLSKFARLIRITLNQSSKTFVSLTDTIDYLERYIEMEKIRSSQFTYTVNVAPDLHPDDVMVPPMLIQPFIENAIWHGTLPKKNTNIHLSFSKKDNELICVIEDDGIGIDESLRNKENSAHEQPVGITNIKQRIHLLNEKYNLHSTIRIEDKKNLSGSSVTGTIVTLHLPIKTNESLWNT